MTDPDPVALRAVLDKWAVPPADMISKLPNGGRKDATNQACTVCNGWHKPGAVHLDYMGHADVTRVLIDTDPCWDWRPLAFDDEGVPLVRVSGSVASLWIVLTVLGQSRIGVGTCETGKPEVLKELVGDALRNAAMRFGIGLSLWSKAEWDDLADEPKSEPAPKAKASGPEPVPEASGGHSALTAQVAALDGSKARSYNTWRKSHGIPALNEPWTADQAASVEAWLEAETEKAS